MGEHELWSCFHVLIQIDESLVHAATLSEFKSRDTSHAINPLMERCSAAALTSTCSHKSSGIEMDFFTAGPAFTASTFFGVGRLNFILIAKK